MKTASQLSSSVENEMIEFARELIRIKSYSGQEEACIKAVAAKMNELNYDHVQIDGMGNVMGTLGHGDSIIMFDSHVDTVEVNDPDDWIVPPFSGDIVEGRLYGRGSVDMKSSVAASVYAGAVAKKQGLLANHKVIVSATVCEENCDGENLKHLFKEFDLCPDFMVICEPSNNQIAIGHNGKAQMRITTKGKSAHGANPNEGHNAIYEMANIIQRVEELNENLMKNGSKSGTIVLSQIGSSGASLNAVPTECQIYLDRRLVPGEDIDLVNKEMEELIKGQSARWEVGTLHCKSWTGLDIEYRPIHQPWTIELDHPLTKLANDAHLEVFDRKPLNYCHWSFSTNAVTPIDLGIPCIGFGPGDHAMAHMTNENCSIEQIKQAMSFYLCMITNFRPA